MQDKFHEATVNLSTQVVETHVRLGANEHGNADYEEILGIERSALEDEGVQAEIAKLQLPEGTAVCGDPWIYGMPEPPFAHIIALTDRGQDPME